MQNWPPLSAEQKNALGYDARHLAHRHKVSRAVAQAIVDRIGPDRERLDQAAKAFTKARAATRAMPESG